MDVELIIAFAVVAVGLGASAAFWLQRRSRRDRRLGHRAKRRIDLFDKDGNSR